MEFLIENASNLGIGIFSILAIVYIIYIHTEERKVERELRETRNRAFMEFISNNNHKITELVKESTTAIVASSKNIEENTKMISRVCEILDRR